MSGPDRKTYDKKDAAGGSNIPKFISNAPWYADGEEPRAKTISYEPERTADKNEWYARGMTAGPAAKKYRKGACENCGAMTHKTRDCLDRPRKIGAKWTSKDIKPDEIVKEVSLNFEGKRDRWNGYDPAAHHLLLEEFEIREQNRKRMKETELEQELSKVEPEEKSPIAEEFVAEDSDDEDQLAQKPNMHVPESKVDTFTRTTIRNLRIREDTAKYLRDIHSNGLEYDPKTRSFKNQVSEIGGEFIKHSGDARDVLNMQVFSWESQKRGLDVNLQADPTKAELLRKEYIKKREDVQEKVKKEILQKYGDEYLKEIPKEFIGSQSESYVEYSQTGKALDKKIRKPVKAISSVYEEDLFEKFASGHTSVWGSHFDTNSGTWGYRCCAVTSRRQMCTGNPRS